MTTNDPYANTPEQPDAQQPEPAAPDYRLNDYGSGDAGYAAPPPAPGFSTGEFAAAPTPAYGAPAPQYGAPAPQYGAPASTSTDGVSIAALIVGLLGGSLVAVILGGIGLKRTAGGIRQGRGMAWAGLILGILGTIAWTLVLVFTIFLVQSDEFQRGFESGYEGSQSDSLFSDAETYGDDPALDVLWNSCAAGDMVACDDLYSQSPFGSDYEEFGDTCGGVGRPAGQLWCAP